MSKFAVLTFIGPGDADAVRMGRMLKSILFYEPSVANIVIIDDRSNQNFERIIPPLLRDRCVILANPRHGRGDWWLAGLCVGLTEGLRWIAENEDVDFVLRLDTDAMVIGACADRIHEKFQSHHTVGLLGTWTKFPVSGRQRLPKVEVADFLSTILTKATKHFAIWRHSSLPTRVQSSLRRSDREVRRVIRTAISNGYSPGDFIQGGGYAIRGKLIKKLHSLGMITSPETYLGQFFGEDVLATLLCFAGNFQPLDFNSNGEVFAVVNTGLPARAEDLIKLGYAVAHSTKIGPNDDVESLDQFTKHQSRQAGM